jgi:Phage integrase, N-terminal SAM-like domain
VPQLLDATRLTVEQSLRQWLDSKKPTVATHTYIPYERDGNNSLVPQQGHQPLAKLAAVQIEKL